MIRIYDYFGKPEIFSIKISSSLPHDNVFVSTLLEIRNSSRHKHSFKVNTTCQNKLLL